MQNKVLYILVFVLLFIFMFNSYSFASTTYTDVNGIVHTLPDLPDDVGSNPYLVSRCEKYNNYALLYTKDTNFSKFVYNTSNNSFAPCDSSGKQCEYIYLLETDSLDNPTKWNIRGSWGLLQPASSHYIIHSTHDIYNSDGSIYFYANINNSKQPSIANTAEDLASFNYDNILILPGSFSENDKFNFVIRKCSEVVLDKNSYESQKIVFSASLDFTSPYFRTTAGDAGFEFWYEVPRESLGLVFNNGEKYIFSIEKDGKILQDIVVTMGGLTQEDIEINRFETIKDAIESSNEKLQGSIEENTQTNKNIFEKIGELLSYINPFSENFFGRKLVELILEGLKSLFVPSEDFFNNWFDDLNTWLGNRFGILYFPTEIVLDFLNRVGGLSSSSECVLNIPELKVNFFGNEVVFFPGYTFNFNELLSNDTFNNVHTIYLTIVDVILYLCLVVLAHNSFSTVFGGHYLDDAVSDATNYVEYKVSTSKKIKPGFYTGGSR